MIDAALFLLSLTGFILLLLATARHHESWLGRKLTSPLGRALRLSGFMSLALAFVVAGAGVGWAYGTLAWFGWLTVAGALVVAVNTNCDQIMRKVRP